MKSSRMNFHYRILFIIVFVSISICLEGQFNIKVGYTGGYTGFSQTESIFERFNENNPDAEKQLSNIHWLNGIDLGARYKFGSIGLDAGVSSISGKSKAVNVLQANGSLGNDEWKISLTNFYVGLENYYGNFGVGANIGYQKLKYKTDVTGQKGKRTIYDQSVLNSRFYFILEAPSNNIAFSVRPFVSVNWKPYNIHEIELSFDPQSTQPVSEFDEDVMIFGISILFCNGPQNKY